MLTRPALPLILVMATANAIAFFVQGTVSMTEVWFIGHLGTEALTAIALMFPALMQMLANGALGGPLSSSVARALGRGRKDQAEALIWHGVVIALAAGGLFWLIWWLGGTALLHQLDWTGRALAAALTGSIGLMLAFAPGLWVGLFTDDPATYIAGAQFLHIAGPLFLFQGLGLALYFGSQGAGVIHWPIAAALVRFVVAIGGALIAVYWFSAGLDVV
ncbi:MatE protein [Marinobacter daqiaonensis]|uniref:MatE protein n=1 Tax=Marinobacter daqiaonensis TaxID=650891 RepID=A0A1I6GQZ7_9GAMM|nr:MATE family efflux transporter [Marinobacter daqiaonensis]SFR44675.1 MatE protein [Marinobacter daqiaonensis]